MDGSASGVALREFDLDAVLPEPPVESVRIGGKPSFEPTLLLLEDELLRYITFEPFMMSYISNESFDHILGCRAFAIQWQQKKVQDDNHDK